MDLKKEIPLSLLALTVIFLMVYTNALWGDFLFGWDDYEQVVNHKEIQQLTGLSLYHLFTHYILGSYQPLASLTFAVEWFFFGENPTVYHFTNLVLGLHNALLLFLILKQWFPQRRFLWWWVTLLFILQPFQVETIAWISTRSTLLSSGFLLWAICVYNGKRVSKTNTSYLANYSLVFLLFLAACFTKSSAIVFAPFLVVLDVFLLRKWKLRFIVEKIPFFLTALVFGFISIDSRGSDGVLQDYFKYYSWWEHVLIKGKAVFFYTLEWLYTAELHVFRPFPKTAFTNLGDWTLTYAWQTLIVLVFFIFCGIYAWKCTDNEKRYGVFLGLGIFFIFIGLNLNLIPVSQNMLAERYNYLACIGIGVVLYFLLIETTYGRYKMYFFLLPFVLILCRFAYVSVNQVPVWRDAKTLFKNDTQYAKDGFSFHHLGILYHKDGNLDKALGFINSAIENDPTGISYYLERGVLLNQLRADGPAYVDFYRVLNFYRDRQGKEVMEKRGTAYFQLGKIFEDSDKIKAVSYYDSAIAMGSPNAFYRKKIIKNTSFKENKPTRESILNLAAKSLARKGYESLKVYAKLLQKNDKTNIIGLKYAIHAYTGLKEYEMAVQLSKRLLGKVPDEEKPKILEFIRKANVNLPLRGTSTLPIGR